MSWRATTACGRDKELSPGEVPASGAEQGTAGVKLTALGIPLVSQEIGNPRGTACFGGSHLVGCQQWLAEGFSPVDGEPGTGYLHPPGRETHGHERG